MTLSLRPLFAAAALVAAPVTSALAAAEASPYYFGINQAFNADTNVFRVRSGEPAPRDLYSSTGLLGGIDQPLGRLRFGGKVAVNANRFKNNKQLNNTDHDSSAFLNWSSVERLSGEVQAYDRQSLNRYDLSTAEGTQTARDLLRVTGATARARVGLVTLWTLEGGYSYEQSEHSLDSLSNRDVRTGAANLGLRLSPSDLWSVRLGVRRTDGKYPRFANTTAGRVTDDFTRDDVDLSLTYVPTSNSALDARISTTREEHSVQSQRDSRYVTGLIGYDWTLTGKTRMRFQFARDTGAGRSDSDLALLTESSDTQVRNALLVKAIWDATSKISVNASVNHSRRKLDNAFTLSDGTTSATTATTARDRLTNVGLGVTYQALRGLLFGCRLAHEERSVQGQNVDTTYPYDVTTGMCNLQWTLR